MDREALSNPHSNLALLTQFFPCRTNGRRERRKRRACHSPIMSLLAQRSWRLCGHHWLNSCSSVPRLLAQRPCLPWDYVWAGCVDLLLSVPPPAYLTTVSLVRVLSSAWTQWFPSMLPLKCQWKSSGLRPCCGSKTVSWLARPHRP